MSDINLSVEGQTPQLQVFSQPEVNIQVSEDGAVQLLASTNDQSVVVEEKPEIQLELRGDPANIISVTEGETRVIQLNIGPRGEAAAPGTANRLEEQYEAAVAISALQAIYIENDGKAYLARSNGTFGQAKCLGIALTSAPLGGQVSVLMLGALSDPFFNYPANTVLFLSTSAGTLSPTAPTSGFSVVVAYSLGSGKIMVKPEEPITM